MPGQDDWDPVLKRAVEVAQAGFPAAYRCCFRRERLFRYCHFLRNGAKPSFNIVGSWQDQDIIEEIALWKRVRDKCFDDGAAIDTLMAVLEERYGHSWQETVALGSNPELANRHMPVWDVGTESLLPQQIGECFIESVFDYTAQSERRDYGYAYRNDDTGECTDLYLYEGNVPAIPDGVGDYIVSHEIHVALEGAILMAERRGVEIHDMTRPVLETVRSPAGSRWDLASVAWSAKYPDGRQLRTSLGLTGFRGGLAKTRRSMDMDFAASEAGARSVANGNSDLADYFFLFR